MWNAIASYSMLTIGLLLFIPTLIPTAYWIYWFGQARKKRPVGLRHFRKTLFNFGFLGALSGMLPPLTFVYLLLTVPPAGFRPGEGLFSFDLPIATLFLTTWMALFWMVRFMLHGMTMLVTEEEVAW